MLKLLKLLLMVGHLLWGFALTIYHVLLRRREPNDPVLQETVRCWYQRACSLIGLTVTVEGEIAKAPVLTVANHISWLDIPLMASLCNPRFLSKAEVRKWPIIGWVAKQLDTLFIVRGDRSAAEAASASISEGLQSGGRILIFPEGKTTDGKAVQFMFPRLLGAAINTASPIQPVLIHYTDDSSPAASSEYVPYIGKQTLVSNMWALLGAKNVKAHVQFLPPVHTQGQPRKALAMGIQSDLDAALQVARARRRAELDPIR